VDGSSNKTVCGAGVVLEGPGDLLIKQALQFSFKATNDQAEYEAILAGLNLANDLGAREVTCKSDSQLVVGQIKGEFEVKEPLLQRYYHTVRNVTAKFDTVTVKQYHGRKTSVSMHSHAWHPRKNKAITDRSSKCD